MEEDDLAIALALEREILKEKRHLICGCVLEAKYGHPTHRDWLLVSKYISVCAAHQRIAESLPQERAQDWRSGGYVPKWRDGNGDWIRREDWQRVNLNDEVPRLQRGVFRHQGSEFLLLVGYLGAPVVLGGHKGPTLRGRIVCLDLATGKTIPKDVADGMLLRFGWKKEG